MKKDYICPWCNRKFSKNVEYKGVVINPQTGTVGNGQGKGSANSTPVKCPQCLNLIPTWDREETKNAVGRKHIHIRR